ncbi:hypothetical protein RIF29_21516 [Crotalaria pallida]|uniref:Uncharacterized protein n=1 Tax=Crotalaria pallida TaxID=3830 RepID=A0AAN9I796_CROPI
MTIEGHGEQGSSESYSSSDHVSESKSSKYQDASTVIGLLQQQGTVPNVNTLLSPLSPSVPVTPQEIPSSKVIESSEKVDEKPHGEIGMAIGSITGSALVSPYENMVSDMPITPSTEVVADPNLHSSEALASAQALIAPSLAGFLTPLALGDLSLLLAFVASRSSFVPLDPALPSFYRQFAYQALVEFLKTVRGAPLPILLESKRDCVLDQLSSLRLMAFHGAWLDDMLAPFSQQTAPSDIMTDIIKEHDSCSARHSDLLEEISNLEERLQSSRAELLALEAQLQVIADKKHMLESAHAAAACLFNF